ncbi:hypothetical protein C3B55_00021 [Candidatus Pseudomonas adelgestsugas]|uniref:Uncharacterized protein n=1 Tax=Candidatus Pseudomonas adelgestsugas TaxID=1302376 RepID=A0ABX5R7W7_9PSED|nr:hypothetical protein C3B55_00021 [Candidatus Pseudomonas adelgestsugas]
MHAFFIASLKHHIMGVVFYVEYAAGKKTQ